MAIVNIKIDNCDGNEYVLFPACCYDGNKFKSLRKAYSPVFEADECSIDMETVITDVPRLIKDGSGKIEVTTGDLSVPCAGVWTPSKETCTFIYTIQNIDNKNLGLAYEKGKFTITYPAKREYLYRWPVMMKNDEKYVDLPANIPYIKLVATCKSIEEFYEIFFKNRKIMGIDDSLPVNISKSKQIAIQLDKFNSMNWYEEMGFYGTNVINDGTGYAWGTGWCGGALISYGMMKLGGEVEYNRGIRTLEFLFSIQGKYGLFYDRVGVNGEIVHTKHGRREDGHLTLTRRSADALYAIFKHFELMDSVTPTMIKGTRRCADAFVNLWDTYGQIGQHVDADTGEIVVGGSASGSLVPAALVSAFRYFNEEQYLEKAQEIGQYFYDNYLSKGYTNGGPGDILQGPDSESAFALLESYVELYDETRQQKWLEYAKFTAHLCSSWVVSYNYQFPKDSEFHKKDMKTIGTVFANVQNKHSAPGICTLSGNSLVKLARFANNEEYLQLYKEISTTISQYMSTNERPIYSWDVPKDAAALGQLDIKVAPEKLPQGFICERVNMSDWESHRCVGGVFNGSCWSEVSNLLTLAEGEFNTIKTIDLE